MANNNKDIVKKSVKKVVSESLPKAVYDDFQSLRVVAKAFVKQVNNLYKQQVHMRGVVDKSNFNTGLQIFYNYTHRSESFTRKILQKQHYFDYNLDKFLGRTIFLTWVSRETGQIFFADSLQTGQIYSRAKKGTKAATLYGATVLNVLDKFPSDVSKLLREELAESVRKRQFVFKQLDRRYSDEHFPYHFWWYEITDTAYKSPIKSKKHQTFGHITGSYVDAVVNDRADIQATGLGPALESSLENIDKITDEGEAIPGVAKGDIVLKRNGDVQFAVKGGPKFSAAKFGPSYNLALSIIDMQPMSAEELSATLQNRSFFDRLEGLYKNVLSQSYDKIERNINQQIQANNLKHKRKRTNRNIRI